MQNDNILATGYNSFVYNTLTGEITATSVKYSSSFYNFLSTNSITYMRIDYPVGAKIIKTVDAKFIPVDGTSIVVDSNGKLAATGGSSSSKYLHKVQIFANYGGTQFIWTEDYVSSSATAYTSLTDYLSDRNYIITNTTSTLSKYIICNISGSNYALAIMTGTTTVYLGTISISSGHAVTANWQAQTTSAVINDEVIAL